MSAAREALGIYVHWPFCAAKCPYCDFNSHVRREVDALRYGDALRRELVHFHQETEGYRVGSIFFGGGTPSLMPARVVGGVIDMVARLWDLDTDAEITLEANPTSVEAARFRGYREAGVNRVSLGVQSLEDESLKFLGRLHSAAQARAAIALARETFDRVSFDLIYARPGQTPESWRRELAAALDLGPDHLSLYQLTIEDGTPFKTLYDAGAFAVPEEECGAALYELTQEMTGAAGLPAYEISNHARPGEESRHNLVYWRYGPYVGVGPGAHGRLPDASGRIATLTEARPEAWLEAVERTGAGLVIRDSLAPGDQAREYLLMGLRLAEGISLARYEALGGVALNGAALGEAVALGLAARDGDRLAATARGRQVLNALIASLL